MTLKIYPSTDVESVLYWNVPNLPGLVSSTDHNWQLSFKSQWSNTVLFIISDPALLGIVTNDRYTQCAFYTTSDDLADRHVNGIYEAELYNEVLGLSHKQLVKLITSPGGSTGTKPYISDNEDREAIVYYKPEY